MNIFLIITIYLASVIIKTSGRPVGEEPTKNVVSVDITTKAEGTSNKPDFIVDSALGFFQKISDRFQAPLYLEYADMNRNSLYGTLLNKYIEKVDQFSSIRKPTPVVDNIDESVKYTNRAERYRPFGENVVNKVETAARGLNDIVQRYVPDDSFIYTLWLPPDRFIKVSRAFTATLNTIGANLSGL